jgi:hypothetical protein
VFEHTAHTDLKKPGNKAFISLPSPEASVLERQKKSSGTFPQRKVPELFRQAKKYWL